MGLACFFLVDILKVVKVTQNPSDCHPIDQKWLAVKRTLFVTGLYRLLLLKNWLRQKIESQEKANLIMKQGTSIQPWDLHNSMCCDVCIVIRGSFFKHCLYINRRKGGNDLPTFCLPDRKINWDGICFTWNKRWKPNRKTSHMKKPYKFLSQTTSIAFKKLIS